MTTSTEPRLLTLHALRVKGLAPREVIIGLSGLSADEVDAQVAQLVTDGLAVAREGRLAGVMLTGPGRELYGILAAENPAEGERRAALEAAYDGFLPVNGAFKRICADWQVRTDTEEPNDHTDADYDAAVVERLGALHADVAVLLGTLAEDVPRYAGYVGRLASCLDRVRGGDTAAFARPMSESYHDIWMELHQDLLLGLDKERGAHDEG